MTLNWTPTINGLKAAHGDRTYYIGKFHDDIHVDYTDANSETKKVRGHVQTTLTSIQFGKIADIAEAKAIAEAHANA